MLITSALAILFNLVMMCTLLFGDGHGHSHGHAHYQPGDVNRSSRMKLVGSEQAVDSEFVSHVDLLKKMKNNENGPTKQNINVRAAVIHVVGDIVHSVGVFVAALIIFINPNWAFMDSICTFIFSILVLITTFQILRDVFMVLMEATPDYMDYEGIRLAFLSIEGVLHVHNLRIWALSMSKIALSAHLAIAKDADPHKILEQATNLVHKQYKFFETTIQIEEYSPEMEDCEHCDSPPATPKKKPPPQVENGDSPDSPNNEPRRSM